jgi:uncharacterized membrane protein YdjX (TVP38/TMEM64 family)
MKKPSKKTVIRLVSSVLVIAAFLGLVYLVFYLLGWTNVTREELQEYVAGTGVWAPLIYVLISFLQVTFIPIPGAVTIIAGSYLFGAGMAFLYSYIGFMVGSVVAFWLGRKIGRPFVNWVFGGKEEVDAYLNRLKGKEKVCLFFMYLLPMFPDDALCAIAGILPITWAEFMVMQIITRATSIGGTLLFMGGEVIPYEGWGLAVIAVVAVLAIVAFVICYRNAEKINLAFDKSMSFLAEKLFRRSQKKQATSSQGEENAKQGDGNASPQETEDIAAPNEAENVTPPDEKEGEKPPQEGVALSDEDTPAEQDEQTIK